MGWKVNPFVPHGPSGPRPGQHPALIASAWRLQRSIGNRRALDVLVAAPPEPPHIEPDTPPPLDPPPPRPHIAAIVASCVGALVLVFGILFAMMQPLQWIVWLPMVAGGAALLALGTWTRGEAATQ